MKTFIHNNHLIETNDPSVVLPKGSVEISNIPQEYRRKPQNFTFNTKTKRFKEKEPDSDVLEKQMEKMRMFFGHANIDEDPGKK